APDVRVNVEREIFPSLVEAGSLYACATAGYWTDIGTPARYLQANLDLVAGRWGLGPPAPHAHRRSPGVWALGAGVVRGQVLGPALIGDAAYVASKATVVRSVIGAGARVEGRARVEGSVLLPGAVVRDAAVSGSIVGPAALVQRGSQVTDGSIVGAGAVVGAGIVLAGGCVEA
ncbi:MAG: hypothetical protein ACRD0D_14535, partial [Acidimicrobiales bacterium]